MAADVLCFDFDERGRFGWTVIRKGVRRARALPARPGIYYLHDAEADLVKIGMSVRDVWARARAQSNEIVKILACVPCSCEEEALLVERAAHYLFRNRRISGEWFSIDADEIVQYDDPGFILDHALDRFGRVCRQTRKMHERGVSLENLARAEDLF